METGIIHFEAFIIAALLFIATPGIDTMFVLNKSLSHGKKAGVLSTMGINAGVLVHTLFASLGLSWLLAQSSLAFEVIKYLGAGYLIYLGLKSIFTKEVDKTEVVQTESRKKKSYQHFMSGLITNVFNPKVALFFLSFFPQFIQPEKIQDTVPFLLLGVTYALIGVLWFMFITLLSAGFSTKIKSNPQFKILMNRFSGVIFILMGIKVAFSKK